MKMASENNGLKRKLSGSVSPPPLRRKVQAQSSMTKTAVASFFTPSSQKPPEKTLWTERGTSDDAPSTLLVGRYNGDHPEPHLTKRRKVAAFDFDSTLIESKSGKKFGSDAQDWKWWHPSVPTTLKKLYAEDGYQVVIVSNQAGIVMKANPKIPKAHLSRLASFKVKAASVLTQLDFPISIYAATEKDIFRKPRLGMWHELLKDYDLTGPEGVDLEQSIFVGDAGGRIAEAGLSKDFSCSDRNFAENVGIKYQTPEEFFLQKPPRKFQRSFEPTAHKGIIKDEEVPSTVSRKNDQDIVLFCGSPGAGKSTTYWRDFEPLGYERINQDLLKTREKCLKVADESLSAGKSIVVDNTNADPDVRSHWVNLAQKHQIPIRCFLFQADSYVCEHNDVVRALNHSMNPEQRTMLPAQAFRGFTTRYRRPELSEGFQDITEIYFKFRGTQAEFDIWVRHWT